jgi:hypothetical protein
LHVTDTVVCTLDWLKETAQIPEGLKQAFDLIIVTIQERNRLQEERQAQNKAYKTQITELINKRNELSYKLLQTFCIQAVSRETSPQPAATVPKSTKLLYPPVFIRTLDLLFEDWLLKIRSKLKANYNYYPTEDLRIEYIENRVGSTAIKYLAP